MNFKSRILSHGKLDLIKMIGVPGFFILFQLISPAFSQAQNQIFPLNPNGDIEYSLMVPIDTLDLMAKYSLSRRFYDSISKVPLKPGGENSFNPVTGNFTRPVGIYLYKKNFVGKNPSGLVIGQCTLIVSEQHFRVIISDLAYSDLVRDRYANFVPVSSKFFPLEELQIHHKSKAWLTKFNQMDKEIKALLSRSEIYLSE